MFAMSPLYKRTMTQGFPAFSRAVFAAEQFLLVVFYDCQIEAGLSYSLQASWRMISYLTILGWCIPESRATSLIAWAGTPSPICCNFSFLRVTVLPVRRFRACTTIIHLTKLLTWSVTIMSRVQTMKLPCIRWRKFPDPWAPGRRRRALWAYWEVLEYWQVLWIAPHPTQRIQ